MKQDHKTAFEFAGWAVFVASACLFIAASVRSGDVLAIGGSVLFLAACFLFMVPILFRPQLAVRNVRRRTKR